MRHKRRLRITVTRRELIYQKIDSSAAGASSWCAQCNGEFSLLSPTAAAELIAVSTREVYRMVESGQVHYVEAPDRELFICLNSLLNAEPNIDINSGVH